jgi:hypothetical protein
MAHPRGRFFVVLAMLASPAGNKGFDMNRQVRALLGSMLSGKFPELPQDRHSAVYVAR